MNSSSTFPTPRVMPNTAHAFGGIWRLTVRRFFTPGHWLVLTGMLTLLVLFAIASMPNSGRLDGYLREMANFYIGFLVPILAFITAGGVMRDDLKADTIDYIYTRPVRRPAFVGFRYLAHVACAQIDFLFALAVVIGVGVAHDVPNIWEAVPLLLLAQVVAIFAFSAFGFLCGMLTSRYVIVGLLYGAIVEVGIGSVPTQLNRISMIRHVMRILHPITGGDPEEAMLLQTVGAGSLSAPESVALLAGIVVLMLGATAALLRAREFAGSTDRDA